METLSNIQKMTADSHHEARKKKVKRKSIFSLDCSLAQLKRATHKSMIFCSLQIWLRSFLQKKSSNKEKGFVTQMKTICLESNDRLHVVWYHSCLLHKLCEISYTWNMNTSVFSYTHALRILTHNLLTFNTYLFHLWHLGDGLLQVFYELEQLLCALSTEIQHLLLIRARTRRHNSDGVRIVWNKNRPNRNITLAKNKVCVVIHWQSWQVLLKVTSRICSLPDSIIHQHQRRHSRKNGICLL